MKMPAPEAALPGRQESMPVPDTHFVNGHRLRGVSNVESLSALIDEMLEGRHPSGGKGVEKTVPPKQD